MAYDWPGYLRAADIQEAEIRYRWDDWSDEQEGPAFNGGATPLDEPIKNMSFRAIMAFTIATAEWILYRFSRLDQDERPAAFLLAAWAQVVDKRYGRGWEGQKLDEYWTGPVRNPIYRAMERVHFAIEQSRKSGDPGWRAKRASSLALWVMPRTEPYLDWSKWALTRLCELYPRRSNPLGKVVPRQALDPAANFTVKRTEPLVRAFLAGLDPSHNPFLDSVEGMKKSGFKGIPYQFPAVDRGRADGADKVR